MYTDCNPTYTGCNPMYPGCNPIVPRLQPYCIQAVGFETNAANSRMLGRSHMRPNGLVDRDLWLLAEPHLDAGAFTSPFGSSYLNVVTYRARSMVRYWRRPELVTAVLAATILGVGLNIQLGTTSRAESSDVVGLVLGERVYSANCASCHGPSGAGNVGPALGAGAVVEKYPFMEDQIAVINEGRGAMPSFANTLTVGEIEAVALFEREQLGQD